MGKLIQKGTQALGLTADPTTGQGAMNQSNALQERAVRELEKIGVPTVEAQKIVLEEPELVLSSLAERIDKSEMENIQVDPRLQEAEMDALASIQEAGEKGFTAEDKARIEALRTQIGADEKARQASILQGMAQRGALDSGAQLAAQLGSSQAATQRASQEGIQLAAQQAAARRNALTQAGQLASQIGSRQFGQQAQQAGAADAIKQFNAAVAARDTAARQQQAQQKANIANQQEMYNKGLIQRQFQNQMAKATGISGALGNQAQGAMNQAQMQAQAAQQQAAGTRGLLIGGAQAYAMSDKKLKTNIDSISSSTNSEELHEMFDKAKPYEYDYKDESYGEGRQRGLMAQDLEKSEKGKEFVVDTPEGKAIDYGKMSSTLAAGISDLHKRVKELEGKKEGQNFNLGGRKMMAGLNEETPLEGTISTPEEAERLNNKFNKQDDLASKEKLLRAIDQFGKGFEQGSAKIKPTQLSNINPFNVQAMQQQFLNGQYADGGSKGMNYEAGGEGTVIDSLEDDVTGDNGFYAGDKLPDRINEGEMVLNLDQQDTINNLLQELGERRRADERVQSGEAIVNEPQQDKLMEVAREQAKPEELVDGGNIVEDVQETMPSQEGSQPIDTSGMEDLLKSLKMTQEGYEFADGGKKYNWIGEPSLSNIYTPYHRMISEGETPEEKALNIDNLTSGLQDELNMTKNRPTEVSPQTPYSNMISEQNNSSLNIDDIISSLNNEKPGMSLEKNTKVEPQLEYSNMMSREETPEEKALDIENILNNFQSKESDYSQMMSKGEPANMSEVNDIVESANAPKKENTKVKPKGDKPVEAKKDKSDDELKSAQNKDMLITLLDNVDRALAHFDAANPNANLTPIQREKIKSNFEAKLLQARQLASQKADKEADRKATADYRNKQLALQESSQKDLKDYRNKQLELAGKELELDKSKPVDKQLAKEQREEQREVKKNLSDVQDKKKKIKQTLDALNKLQKDTTVADTGPIDQYISTNTDAGQKLQQQFNDLTLDKMTKMFAGMSKAIDSDSEREFFMKSQAGMSLYPQVNKDILNDQLKALGSLEKKLNAQLGKAPAKTESKSQAKQPTSEQVSKYVEMHGVSEDQAIQILTQRLNR